MPQRDRHHNPGLAAREWSTQYPMSRSDPNPRPNPPQTVGIQDLTPPMGSQWPGVVGPISGAAVGSALRALGSFVAHLR